MDVVGPDLQAKVRGVPGREGCGALISGKGAPKPARQPRPPAPQLLLFCLPRGSAAGLVSCVGEA